MVTASAEQTFDPSRGILLKGTVVTMDTAGTILHHGSVLVRDGRIVAAWRGANAPSGVTFGNPVVVDLGPGAEIFPGLINLHDHPTFDVLELWPTPSSHVEPTLGRPLDPTPPFMLYLTNFNQAQPSGNPFAAADYRDRYFNFCAQ